MLPSSARTQVDRPQNGANSHVWPGSMVAHRVEAKHMPGKSETKIYTRVIDTFTSNKNLVPQLNHIFRLNVGFFIGLETMIGACVLVSPNFLGFF